MGRVMLWETWLAAWRSWTATSAWREEIGAALWKDASDGVSAVTDMVADRVSQVVRLERMLAVDAIPDERESPPPDGGRS